MPDSDKNLRFEIGHVLFIDIVGYSKLLIEEQKERLNQLTEIVLATAQVRETSEEPLVRLPTGDGMALVFRHSAEEPARCALEIAEALRKHPELPVRMGIHSGPVSEMTDVSGRTNIAGGGINTAQRVMDCGDAGHILLSQHVADDLMQYRQWAPRLHDLGDCEVKHGVRLHLVNLYAEPLGNAALPQKFQQTTDKPAGDKPARRSSVGWVAVLLLVALLGAGAAYYFISHRPGTKDAAIPEKSHRTIPAVSSETTALVSVTPTAGPLTPSPIPAPVVPSASTIGQTDAPRAKDETPTQFLRDLATEYIVAGSSPSVDREMALYADQVDFYNEGIKTRNEIRTSLVKTRQKWPSRRYQVLQVLRTHYDLQQDTGDIVVSFAYDLSNGSKHSVGQASTSLLFGTLSHNPKLISVKEEKIQR